MIEHGDDFGKKKKSEDAADIADKKEIWELCSSGILRSG